MRKVAAVFVLVLASLGAIENAAASRKPVHQYALKHRSQSCRVGYRKETIHVRRVRHGRIVRLRVVGCMLVPEVRAAIDPSFTQDPSNPLSVTFSFSASDVNQTTLPAGTLTLTIEPTGATGPSSTCSANVGNKVQGSSCTVTLSSYGSWDLVVSYSGGAGVAATSSTEAVNIANPNPTTLGSVGSASPAPAGASGTTTTSSTTTTLPPPVVVTIDSATPPSTCTGGSIIVVANATQGGAFTRGYLSLVSPDVDAQYLPLGFDTDPAHPTWYEVSFGPSPGHCGQAVQGIVLFTPQPFTGSWGSGYNSSTPQAPFSVQMPAS